MAKGKPAPAAPEPVEEKFVQAPFVYAIVKEMGSGATTKSVEEHIRRTHGDEIMGKINNLANSVSQAKTKLGFKKGKPTPADDGTVDYVGAIREIKILLASGDKDEIRKMITTVAALVESIGVDKLNELVTVLAD